MLSYLLDESGTKWSPTDPTLKSHLSTARDGEILVKFLIENLGWVKITEGPHSVRVACRPAFVSDQTLAALLIALYEAQPTTIGFDVFDANWEHLLLRDRRAFVRLISALVSGRRKAVNWQEPRLLSAEFEQAGHPLESAAQMGTIASRMAENPDQLREAFDAIFHGRWYLCAVDADNGHSYASAIGASFTPFNPSWSSNGEGESLCKYADDAYGLWIAAHHRHVLTLKQPVFDDIDAMVLFPRIGDTRLRYRRVTLPIKLRRGQELVLVAAVTDSRINLRKLARQEER